MSETLRETIAEHFNKAINLGIKFKATDIHGISLEYADQVLTAVAEWLDSECPHRVVFKWNRWCCKRCQEELRTQAEGKEVEQNGS